MTYLTRMDMPLGKWLRCGDCHTYWNHYPAGYELNVVDHLADGSYRVTWDCPKCHSMHIQELEPAPEQVPADYIPADCANPACDGITWIPNLDGVDLGETKLVAACSPECAMKAVTSFT